MTLPGPRAIMFVVHSAARCFSSLVLANPRPLAAQPLRLPFCRALAAVVVVVAALTSLRLTP